MAVLTVRLDGSGFRENFTIEIQKSDGSNAKSDQDRSLGRSDVFEDPFPRTDRANQH
jgi:hypothetical protein